MNTAKAIDLSAILSVSENHFCWLHLVFFT